MNKRMALLGALALVCACADDDDPSPSERLQGKWMSVDSQVVCVTGLIFDGERVELDTICEHDDGSVGIEAVLGNYTVEGDTFTWAPDASSCRDVDQEPETIAFDFVNGSLRLTTPEGVILLEKAPPPSGGSGVASFGCYDDEGYFDEQPVKPL